MDELVKKLSNGRHPVTAERAGTVDELEKQIERKFVLIKFTETKGGTELGYELDDERSHLGDADFTAGTGSVRLVGQLSLNYEKVRCIADIDLATLQGEAYLEPVE